MFVFCASLSFFFLSVIVIVSAVDVSGNTALIVVFRPISLISYLSLKLVIYSLVFNVTFIALRPYHFKIPGGHIEFRLFIEMQTL